MIRSRVLLLRLSILVLNLTSLYGEHCSNLRNPLTIPEAESTPLLYWLGGGSGGTGNTLVGYLTTFYDAMLMRRRLVMARTPEFKFNDISMAFDTGVPFLEDSLEFDDHHKKRVYPHVYFESRHGLPPAARFKFQGKIINPSDFHVIQSRHHNVHFVRPDIKVTNGTATLACYFQVLGCKTPPTKAINIQKQEGNPDEYCFESQALQYLILGVSKRLLAVAPVFEKAWLGSADRWRALLSARSQPHGAAAPNMEEVSFERPVTSLSTPRAKAIWDVAVHARVGFKFVEMGQGESDNSKAIDDWLHLDATRKAFAGLVAQVMAKLRERKAGGADYADLLAPGVYVASETARVRTHLADLIRTSALQAGLPVEVDFFNFSGTAHPVDINGNHRSDGPVGVSIAAAAAGPSEARDKAEADLLFPYLEWWALAHSRVILVRRGLDLKPIGSTYSGTAHLYGQWAQ